MTALRFCTADFNYVRGDDYQRGNAGDNTAPVSAEVYDGRTADLPGWETCGFELKSHVSAINDWQDDAEIAATHYLEISDLAKQLTGCDHALVSSHIKRNPEQAKRHPDLAPITFVHSDFAASYDQRMRDHYESPGPEGERSLERAGITSADVRAAKRMVIIQFWRNLGPRKMDLPIAFCDARTVAGKELMAIEVKDYAGDGFTFETLGVKAPADQHHRWYVFPELGEDEVVVFRTFDSSLVGQDRPFWTPHSAFRDPAVSPGRPSRSSIELRATCLFV